VADGPADPALAKAILARYARKGQKTLDARALGFAQERFALLDRDGNGQLDQEELARLGPLTPDLELTVRLGKRGGKQPVVEVHRARPGLAARFTTTPEGVTLELGTVALELRGPGAQANMRFAIDFKAQYTTQFRMADRDNNGYLDKAEAEKSPFFRNLFAVMDRDGDGMLFEKEMLAYVGRVDGLRTRASASCVSLVVTDQGKGLFEMIDGDGDGRLSVRELRRLAELVKKLDLDGDGTLARTEVPRRYKGAFERGPVGGGGGRFAIVLANGFEAAPRPPARSVGPLWFRKMDRNRDGDVSRREFLGTEEDFKAVDTDGDGLISAAEAERYDQARRKKAG
jgi:Ca2+-binding EF-hand superfamily protein